MKKNTNYKGQGKVILLGVMILFILFLTINISAEPWNITSSTIKGNFSVADKESNAQGLALSYDGTELYISGTTEDVFAQYTLSSPWDVTTKSFIQTKSTGIAGASGLHIKSDGTRFYVINSALPAWQYNFGVAYDISTITKDGSYAVGEMTDADDIYVNPDGTKLYTTGATNKAVFQYTLATPYNISTGSYVRSFTTSTWETNPRGVTFSENGSKMYIVGDENEVNEFGLSTAWDISTATFVQNLNLATYNILNPGAIRFSPDGTHFYVLASGKVYQFDMKSSDSSPIVTLNSPANSFSTKLLNITFNCSATDDFKIQNISLYINDVLNYTKTNGVTNFSELNITNNFDIGQYNWSCRVYDNATQQTNSSTRTFSVNMFTEQLQTFNISSYETKKESYVINISYDSTKFSSVSANLFYNGTSYVGIKEGIGDNVSFTNTHDLPIVPNGANYTFYWAITLNDASPHITNSNSSIQHIENISFGLCNSSLTTSYINYTFKDEVTLSSLSGSFPYSSFIYWLGSGTKTKTYSFTNLSYNPSYAFCFSPSDQTLNLGTNVQYQAAGYNQRISSLNFVLTNITTNKTLYLLNTSSGIYVTFQVVSPASQTISGVSVNASRQINGVDTLIGSGVTGSDGAITFFLNPNFAHTFTFLKSGYEPLTETITPTQSIYTIKMLISGTVSNDYRQGVSISINPSFDFLLNNTIYNFNMTLNSSIYSISNFGFGLYYNNNSLIGSQSSTSSTGGFLSFNADTSNSTGIYMNYYYTTNGTTFNYTTFWITELSPNSFSITHFFSDLNLYLSAGLFGIDNFGKVLISFVLLVLMVGFFTYRYGIANEAAIMGIIFGLVFFLDTIGFLPQPAFLGITPKDHFITIITGIIFGGLIVREEMRY